MRIHLLLIPSLVLNLALAVYVGYLLGASRPTPSTATDLLAPTAAASPEKPISPPSPPSRTPVGGVEPEAIRAFSPAADGFAAPALTPASLPGGTISSRVATASPSSASSPAVAVARQSYPPTSSQPGQGDAQEEVTEVNPAAPGNSIRFRGVRVAVAQTFPSNEPGGQALAVDVSPEADSDAESADATNSAADSANSDSLDPANQISVSGPSSTAPTQSAQPGGNAPSTASSNNEIQASGFTREEELFRMKWGWAAFDAMRSEARKEAGKKKASE